VLRGAEFVEIGTERGDYSFLAKEDTPADPNDLKFLPADLGAKGGLGERQRFRGLVDGQELRRVSGHPDQLLG